MVRQRRPQRRTERLAPVPDGPRARPGCRKGSRQAPPRRQARHRKVGGNLPASAGRALQYPHYVHAKAHPLTAVSLLSATHSDRLATRISDLLTRQGGSADAFRETEERALHLKTAFYDQFLPALDRVEAPQP